MEHIHETYNKNMTEIGRLWKFQVVLRDRPDFRRNLEVLNKSGIVLLIACWESFVEGLASEAFNFLLTNAIDHKVFSTKVLTHASKTFWDSKDERGVWSLADDGWKTLLASHKDNTLKEYLGNFNTPRPRQVDTLFETLIGLKNFSSHWHWKGMNSDRAKKKLDELVSLRGSIAHRVAASKVVTERGFHSHAVFITRLGLVASNTVRSFVQTRVGKYPWNVIKLKWD
ncbi:MAG TPA: HEPN domain-containing protein [Pyrinomonadaceae bacterium]|jgi:hypothetical protein